MPAVIVESDRCRFDRMRGALTGICRSEANSNGQIRSQVQRAIENSLPVVPVGVRCHVTRAIIVLSLNSRHDGHTGNNDRLASERHVEKVGKLEGLERGKLD